MTSPLSSKSALLSAIAAGAIALTLAPALAQEYDVSATPVVGGPNETVTVIAPRFHADSTPLNGPLEKISLSMPIHYRTADLLTPRGVHALRRRVWHTAAEVCGRLAEAYPVYPSTTSPHCFREAYNTAMARIDARATGARLDYYGY
jgi:UrcA family protein